jgi:2-keto-3-deoxy-L-arabinonate dehydratase
LCRAACELVRLYQDLGADVICFVSPRQFPLAEADILRYCEAVINAVKLPVLIQDFNPGGPSVSEEFVRCLREATPNFNYLKLEEPMMRKRVKTIRKITEDHSGILEGWGGMYLLELLPDGIVGVMPGLSMCDLFVRLWSFFQSGDTKGAEEIYRIQLPFISPQPAKLGTFPSL